MSDPLRRATGCSLEEFASQYWSVAPLLRRAAELPGAFGDLLSLESVDELISRRGVRTPFARMSRDGELLPASRFTRGGGAGAEIGDQLADDKVLAEFAAGATLVLQGLHRLWPPIRTFADELSSQLGHPVQVNAYVTPPQNKGFAAHYDVHDVFVLQFAGRKRWRIHAPVWDAPLRDQPWQTRKAEIAAACETTPALETVLESGDALYLPRGYIHAATSLGDVSGHLTVGVHPVTRHAIVDRIVTSLGDDVELRRSLPAGVDLSDPSQLERDIDSTLDAMRAAIDRVDRGAIARALGRHLATYTRPEPLRPLEQMSAAATLTPQRRVRLRPGLRVVTRVEGDRLLIESHDGAVRVPALAADAMDVIASGVAVAAGELPGFDASAAVEFVARLLRSGIVVPA